MRTKRAFLPGIEFRDANWVSAACSRDAPTADAGRDTNTATTTQHRSKKHGPMGREFKLPKKGERRENYEDQPRAIKMFESRLTQQENLMLSTRRAAFQ